MIVTVTEFNTYSGNYENDTAVTSMKESILAAAEEKVVDYLGFSPLSAERTDFISAIGQKRLYLYAHPITAVSSLKINGAAVDASAFTINDCYLRLKEGVFPVGDENCEVTYTAGWTSQNMPDVIKMVILQIASLMLEEAGGNIGITGKSFDDNSRNFINYTDFNKWLAKLDGLRVLRMD